MLHVALFFSGQRLVNSSYDVNSVVIDFSIEPAPSKLNSPLIAEFEYLSVSYYMYII